MTWLLTWILFGLLAADEIGGLAAAADGEWPIALALVYALLGAGALALLIRGAVKRGRSAKLGLVSAVCLAGLGLAFWWIRDAEADARAVSTLMAAAAYFVSSQCAAVIALPFCWRARMRKRKSRREQAMRVDHRQRLDRMGMPMDPTFEAMGLRPEDEPWPAGLDPDMEFPLTGSSRPAPTDRVAADPAAQSPDRAAQPMPRR